MLLTCMLNSRNQFVSYFMIEKLVKPLARAKAAIASQLAWHSHVVQNYRRVEFKNFNRVLWPL
jgi:hypothetical protein